MATYIEGRTFDVMPGIEFANSAGHLVGKFHRALSSLDYNFKHESKNWHWTEFYINRLCTSLENCNDKNILLLQNDILKLYQSLKIPKFTPQHIVHGDLKTSNILFEPTSSKAICLIDLDTLRKGSISLEMGDAMRSWCNQGGADSEKISFNLELFVAAMESYISEVHNIVEDHELLAIPWATAIISLELCSRFLEDAHTQSYFQLDSRHYDTLYEQNLNKAINLLKLFYDIRKKEDKAVNMIKDLIKK
jgi:Ser/Thr protein kinase RdoA (MazF antagonist)